MPRGPKLRRGGTRAQREGVTQRRRAGVVLDLQVLGTKEVRKNLIKLKLSVGRKVVNKALELAAAGILQPAIDANISEISPGRFGTGLLKDRETEVAKISKKAAHLGYHVRTPSRTDLNIQGEEPYYPFLIEQGAQNLEGRHMLKRARDQVSGRIKKSLRKTIRKFMEAEIVFIAGKDAKRVAQGKKPLGAFRSKSQLASFRKRGII